MKASVIKKQKYEERLSRILAAPRGYLNIAKIKKLVLQADKEIETLSIELRELTEIKKK